MEIKILRDNFNLLYTFCSPSLDSTKESINFFQSKTKDGWMALVLIDEDTVKATAILQPLESSFINLEGDELFYLPCIWVKPGEERKGYGSALLTKILEISQHRKGIATITMEKWMPKTFFEKFNFIKFAQIGPFTIYFKKLQPNAKISIIHIPFKPIKIPGKVTIEVINNFTCPFLIHNYNLAIQKALEYSPHVQVFKHNLYNRKDALKFGDGNFYLDGETPFVGPVDIKKLEELIQTKLISLKNN